MAEFRFRTLEQFQIGGTTDEMQLALPLTRSPRGLVYRSCPNEGCSPGLFLVGEPPEAQSLAPGRIDLVRRQPGMPGMTCPYCGRDDEDSSFTFAGDIEAAKNYIAWAAKKDAADFLGSALENMTRTINRGRGAITARYNKGPEEPKLFTWREDLLRNLTCDTCNRPYGVYAIGLFCPGCGAENVHVHFRREIELIGKQIQLARTIEEEELSYRLLGNAHEDVVTALETYLKTIFRFIVKRRHPERYEDLCSKNAIGNRFQNIERGRELYTQLAMDPFAGRSPDDLDTLRRNIQKRHIVGHNLSMADEGYVRTAEDERAGQTVRLLADDITRFSELCGEIIRDLARGVTEFHERIIRDSSAISSPLQQSKEL